MKLVVLERSPRLLSSIDEIMMFGISVGDVVFYRLKSPCVFEDDEGRPKLSVTTGVEVLWLVAAIDGVL